jgi:Putative transposase
VGIALDNLAVERTVWLAFPRHGRYTHRVALSNDRLVALTDGRVRFRWRDYADGDRLKVMELWPHLGSRGGVTHCMGAFSRIRPDWARLLCGPR